MCAQPLQPITTHPDHHLFVSSAARFLVEVKCFSAASSQKRFSSFTIKPSGVVIQGSKSNVSLGEWSGRGWSVGWSVRVSCVVILLHPVSNFEIPQLADIGQLYANATGQSLQRYELTDARACQLLVVSHLDSFWAVPAPEVRVFEEKNALRCQL